MCVSNIADNYVPPIGGKSGMTAVQFFQDMPITNAACCNNPRIQCEKCAAAAMRKKFPTFNRSQLVTNNKDSQMPSSLQRQVQILNDASNPPTPLGMPEWDWQQIAAANGTKPKAAAVANAQDKPAPSGSPLDAWDFEAISKQNANR